MQSEPLIQKLFAIERAIGLVQTAELRAMVIEAEEAALRMDLDTLHAVDELQQRLLRHAEEARSDSFSSQGPPSLQRSA